MVIGNLRRERETGRQEALVRQGGIAEQTKAIVVFMVSEIILGKMLGS